MKSSNHIIDVSETDFQNEVIAYSAQFPVIVDFWADWCIPCRTLGPILEKLANEAQGAFRLAKVNVDENPNLANHYMIASIPAVKAFRDGQVVNEFIGVKPEPDLRQFLRELAPSQSDLKLEKGINLLRAAQWTNAAEVFREVLRSSPDHSQALLGLAKSLLAQGRSPDALIILREFPASKEYSAAEQLLPLANAMAASKLGETSQSNDEEALAAAFEHILKLTSLGNIAGAIDGALDIMREDKSYRGGEIHKIILALLEMLGDHDPQTRTYRAELSSLLF